MKKQLAFAIVFLALTSLARAADKADAQPLIDKGLNYLKAQQKPDGGWQANEKVPPAVTAVVLRAFVMDDKNYTSKTDFIAKGYDKLLTYQLDNGGIYQDVLANYNTSIALSSLSATNDPKFKPAIDKGIAYLKSIQWTEKTPAGPKGEKVADDKNPWYGGTGYGGQSRGGGRPDMSNLQMTLEALHDAGLKPDDPAYKAALKFITRQQNLSETNDQPWAGNDGGFVYGPGQDGKGESFAGEYTGPDGKRMLRSYGSMTYAGLKSMIYAGLTKDDPRVKACWDWIGKNWTLEENPGLKAGNPAFAKFGLYYYYLTLSRALHAYGDPIITDPQGNKHDWRVELISKLTSLQQPDGSWVGDKKWMEDNPVMTTAFVVMALEEAQADLKEHPAK